MSRTKIKNLVARKERQKITAGLTNAERMAWGDGGRRLTKQGKPIFPDLGYKTAKKK